MIKKVAIFLTILMLIITGCSINQSSVELPITIDILYNDIEEIPFQENWQIFEEYEVAKNVAFEVRLGDNSDYEKEIDLNIHAEVPPDIILKCWPDTIEGYANEGLLLPINDYVHLMPYFQAYITENKLESELDNLRLSNGNYYIMPGFQRGQQVQQWIYRKDLFIENNLSTPTTYDDLLESLVILKDLYPETTPITASWGGAHLLSMMGAGYGIPAGWSGTRFYDEANDRWLYSPATDNYRELYQYLNKCYTAGVLDPAFFDQSNEEFIEKIVNGKALVTVTWVSSGFDTWNNQLQDQGFANGEWVALPVMESTMGLKALPSVGKFRKGLVVTANALDKPYFEDMIKFLDWAIYSDEGIDLTYWGIEGLTYQVEAGKKAFLPSVITPKNQSGTVSISEEYGFDLLFNLNENEEFEDSKKPEEIVTFLAASEEAGETLPLMPNLVLDDESINMEKLISSELSQYVELTSKQFITGELSIDAHWDEYLQKLDDIGYTVLEQIWNNAWVK